MPIGALQPCYRVIYSVSKENYSSIAAWAPTIYLDYSITYNLGVREVSVKITFQNCFKSFCCD